MTAVIILKIIGVLFIAGYEIEEKTESEVMDKS